MMDLDLHLLGVFLFRWLHVLFGIVWIGMLYYFNFVQGEYFKEATPDAKGDAMKKLVPRALWYFRWAAMFTFITGVVLIAPLIVGKAVNLHILAGALMGTLMFLNVWLIIWPNQQVVIGIKEGDKAVAGGKALLASRTNVLFSGPMLFGMLASPHLGGHGSYLAGSTASVVSLSLVLAIIAALEVNAVMGKVGPLATVKGVIHCSLALTAVIFGLMIAI